MKLSIIVPVYNVAPYLRKCVDSLLAQDLSLEDYEIILVDDGSLDFSPTICDEYAREYENIRVVHRQNRGLSTARNIGIEIASGQYVQFVDSDDYLEPNVLDGLVKKMEFDQLDVLRFNYQNVNEAYEVFEPNKVSKQFVDYRDEICDGLSFLKERLGYVCYACQFMIRKSLLETNRIWFKTGIIFEDTEWTPRVLLKAERVQSFDKIVYNYLQREGSITKGPAEKTITAQLSLIDYLKLQMPQFPDHRWHQGMISHIVVSIVTKISTVLYNKRNSFLKDLRNKEVYPLSTYLACPKAMRKIRLINLSPRIACFVIHVINVLKNDS